MEYSTPPTLRASGANTLLLWGPRFKRDFCIAGGRALRGQGIAVQTEIDRESREVGRGDHLERGQHNHCIQ